MQKRSKRSPNTHSSPEDCDTTIVIKHSTSKPNVKFEPMEEKDFEDFTPHKTPSQLSVRTTINIDDSPDGKYGTEGTTESEDEGTVYYPRAHRPKKKQFTPESPPKKLPFIRYKIELTDSDDDDDDYFIPIKPALHESLGKRNASRFREHGYNVKHKILVGNDGASK
ncbi:uncharacterized protein LOC111623738 [Centruroides sculpturatus]|uniref:uncharacterized protein LOC111623738 n=2 Tax=Centruroides sculpturatus TaxID=218467 RepID=UPI000C6E9002|nr:uncharacterized protein LOC111623738 [Centruroides sculpturatus]